MRAPTRLLAVAIVVVSATTGLSTPAFAASAANRYRTCAAVHLLYSGGIAKKGVTSNTVHSHGTIVHRALRGRVKHSTALYEANAKLDRDKDGIACEQS